MAARAFARVAPVRAKFALVAVVALAVGLSGRLGYVQIHQGPWLARTALAQHDEAVEMFARRGAILDRDGGVLVRSLPSESIYVVPSEVTNAHADAVKLAPILNEPVAELERSLRAKVEFGWIARKVHHEIADRVHRLGLAGVDTKPEETGLRYVASGRLASTVVGFTGTDENGLDGLEYSLDKVLRATSGRMLIEADLYGRPVPFGQVHVVERAQAGRTIVTTIDPYLQYEAERLLRAFPPDSWRDRAISDAYEPGSTFKLITAAAALESGKFTTASRFPARDALEVGGRVIHNAEDGMMAANLGSESIEEIIAYSHNVGAAEVGLATGATQMYRMIRNFGFGDPKGTQVELSGENPGIVNAPAEWSGSSLATISFGHSISVTPLALVRAYAAIANGGLLLRPRVVGAIEDIDGSTIYRYGREVERRVIKPATAATLRGFLRAVVLHGTGNPTAQVAGYTTAGKTGTAQVVENGRYLSGAYVASFVGMIPAEHPRYVILVKVDRPRGSIYGSQVAAPVFSELARAAMLHAGIMPAISAPPRLVRTGQAPKVHR